MHRRLEWLAPLLVVAAVALPAQAGAATQAGVDVDRLGPQVGETAPVFTLPDQGGVRRSLASLMGPEGLVLVFSRSADW